MAVLRRRQCSAEKWKCHIPDDTMTQLPSPSGLTSDPFADVLRDGARKLIEQAIQAELAVLMSAFSGEKLEDGGDDALAHEAGGGAPMAGPANRAA